MATGQPFTQADSEQAKTLYQSKPTPVAQPFLDFLASHPGETFDSDMLVEQLGLDDHRLIGQTTFALGKVANDLDRQRPWSEGQRGYSMPPEIASLFR